MPIDRLRYMDYRRTRRARIAVHREHRQSSMHQHRHDFCELVLINGGTGIHVTGRDRRELARGDILVISGQRAHGYEKSQGLDLLNILIRPDLLPRMAREMRVLPGYYALFGDLRGRKPFVSHMRLSDADYKQVEEWAVKLEVETRKEEEAGLLLAEAYLILILGLLARRYAKTPEVRTRHKQVSQIHQAVDLLERQFDVPLKVATVAQKVGLSERSFFRIFRQHLGTTPNAYLLQIRLQHACERLAHGDPQRRIGEIALECGFEDTNYFSRLFGRTLGMSPREYRERHRKATGR